MDGVTLFSPYTYPWVDCAARDFDSYASEYVRLQWEFRTARIRSWASVEPRRSDWAMEYYRCASVLYNGFTIASDGKLAFTRLVRELGFSAPASVLVGHGDRGSETLKAIRQLDDSLDGLLCKPLAKSRRRGVFTADSPEMALAATRERSGPYLVQDLRPPTRGEFRYILHRTADNLSSGGPPNIRVAYRKLGPWNIGFESPRPYRLLQQIRWRDEGSPYLRFRAEPEPHELRELDAYMLALITALEDNAGRRIATLGVDVSLTDEGPCIYELQFPFSPPYRWTRQEGARAVSKAFYRSVLYSGCIARDIQRKTNS